MPSKPRVIDSHAYCLPPRLRDPRVRLPAAEAAVARAIHRHKDGAWVLPLSAPEAIERSMSRCGIDASALISFPWATPALCAETNDFTLERARARPDRFYAVCSVQPAKAGHLAEARRALDAGAVGIKVNPEWQGWTLDDGKTNRLMRLLADRGAYLLTHVDQPFRRSNASPAQLLALARAHPRTRIVAAHMGGLLPFYEKLPWIRPALKNVWFDTAVSETLDTVRWAVERGLGRRILFGTDHPFNTPHDQATVLARVKALGLPRAVLADILGGNYARLLGKSE